MDEQDLIDAALTVRKNAYCRYSNYYVGAALLDDNGKLHVGCNVENASFPVTLCAERVALGAAVASGATSLVRLFLVSDAETPIAPCGMCRQALAEFAPALEVESEGRTGGRMSWTLGALLPDRFSLSAVSEGARGGRE